MWGNFDVAAGAKVSWRVLAFDLEARRPRNQKNPFRPILVAPKPGWARLTGRDDPFDLGARRVGKDRDLLFARTRRQARKQIAASNHDGLLPVGEFLLGSAIVRRRDGILTRPDIISFGTLAIRANGSMPYRIRRPEGGSFGRNEAQSRFAVGGLLSACGGHGGEERGARQCNGDIAGFRRVARVGGCHGDLHGDRAHRNIDGDGIAWKSTS